ncbi:hypothetical protein CLU79DRAFT_850112 [Phycomyces nitens]|nr:hypothetical protein CLU79DRAFT_850112 [Phycomyces nitens]
MDDREIRRRRLVDTDDEYERKRIRALTDDTTDTAYDDFEPTLSSDTSPFSSPMWLSLLDYSQICGHSKEIRFRRSCTICIGITSKKKSERLYFRLFFERLKVLG